MYRVYSDNLKIYDSRIDKYKIFDAKLSLELNKTGSFTFTVYPDHPNFNALIQMSSIITVYQDDYLIFRGRILDAENGFYNEKFITCEGELAFLIDSQIRPYGSTETPWTGTPAEYLEKILTEHNSQVEEWKKFKLGTVTVTDGDTSNTANQIQRSDSEYKTSWDLINEKLIDSLGGYLWVRHEADGNYIDYLEDFDVLSNQKIEFGKNLLDIVKNSKGADLATAIIPLGAKPEDSETRLTIESVNDGKDYLVDEESKALYGWICKTVVFEDVTVAENLKAKGQTYLASAVGLPTSIELTAADLSGITDVNPFRLGRYIVVKSKPHGLDTFDSDLEFLIEKLSIDVLNPANNTLTVGTTYKTFTESITSSNQTTNKVVEKVEKIEQSIAQGGVTKDQMDNAIDEAVTEVTEQSSSTINQLSTEIMTQVSKDYFLKSDADQLVESVNTKFTQTNEEFEFRFNEFAQDVNDVASGADARFNEISKYIRFVDGNIVLGEDGNELTLRIQNDRISFMESGAEVAYLSNRKLYVTDGQYINSLRLGNFAFLPRANGNLSFKKVT